MRSNRSRFNARTLRLALSAVVLMSCAGTALAGGIHTQGGRMAPAGFIHLGPTAESGGLPSIHDLPEEGLSGSFKRQLQEDWSVGEDDPLGLSYETGDVTSSPARSARRLSFHADATELGTYVAGGATPTAATILHPALAAGRTDERSTAVGTPASPLRDADHTARASPDATPDLPAARTSAQTIQGARRDTPSAPIAMTGGGTLASKLILSLAAGTLLATAASLYSRLTRREIAEQSTRERILAHLAVTPGETPANLSRAIGAHRTTVEYHVRVLAREGLLTLRPIRRRLHCYLTGAAPAAPDARLQVLRAEGARKLYDAILASPGVGASEAARAVGLERTTVHYHVRHLSASGLIRVEREGHARRLFPAGAPTPAA